MAESMTPPVTKKPWQRERQIFTSERDTDSWTDRSFGNDTDVNKIVARFARTGTLPEGQGNGQYADVTRLQRDTAQMILESRAALEELKEWQKKDAELHEKSLKAKLARLEELEAKQQDNGEGATEDG